jgi:beta-lactamase class D
MWALVTIGKPPDSRIEMMRNFIISVFSFFLGCVPVLASNSAFIAIDDKSVIKEVGSVNARHAPFSTFKVALSLMGFDSGFLTSKDAPKFAFKKEYEEKFPEWYNPAVGIKYHWDQDHTPATFMKNSVLWYSHRITEHLGKEKFAEYVRKFKYGNQDVSGTPRKDDSLYMSWLGSSLQISPQEQVEFLKKLFADDAIASKEAKELTRSVMDREEVWSGWKLYGKTGGGNGRNGWFVGWIEKGNERIIFAQYLDLDDAKIDMKDIPEQKSIGLTAKEFARRNLAEFIW